MNLFLTCSGLYLGRKITGKEDKNEIPSDVNTDSKES
jgi:hypothetical protein